jgi:2-polyprenyl-3-methyl-5-hydroxy-6-metoxy-1,4-benzoquinol methylase
MSRSKGLKEKYYPESAFGGYSRVDGTVPFFQRVQALARPEMVVLDVGCGRGAVVDRLERDPWEKCRILKGVCKKVIGIDVTDAGRENVLIDEFRRIEGDRWPVESESIDLLVSDAVLEHLADPDLFFSECCRVVKPDGYACFRTPNRWGYPFIAATIIPNRLHAKVISFVQPGREAHDVFPTYYRANTVGALRRLLRNHQFEGCVIRHISEPTYLGFSRWSYALGVYLHRWLPGVLWPGLFVFARRIGNHQLQ